MLKTLNNTILRGWPEERTEVPAQITPYFSVRDELSIQDGVIYRGQRIIIPTSLRSDMKHKLHASHQGTESFLRRARETVFWYVRRSQGTHCRPWEQVGVNLFELDKKDYMITVDYYSNFWKVDRLTSTTSTTVILKLKKHFARHGCPERSSDQRQRPTISFLRIPEVFQGMGFRAEYEESRKEQRKWESQCKGKCSESCEKPDSESSSLMLDPTHTFPSSITETHPHKGWNQAQYSG